MDDYLTDKEQAERLRAWWRENGWFLIGGVAIGLLALYGYRQYFAYQDRQSENAAALYDAVRAAADDSNTAAAETAFTQLRSEFPEHVYTFQAAMLVASEEVVTAPDSAAEKLRFTMENSDDPELAMVARLRLARVLAYREQYAEALATLNVPAPGQFAGRIAEIKGDIHVAQGEMDAARTAYLEAMVSPGAELLDRGFLQMKLADLPAAAPAPGVGAAPNVDGAPPAPASSANPSATPESAPAAAGPAGEGA